jgi:hypothetical protein
MHSAVDRHMRKGVPLCNVDLLVRTLFRANEAATQYRLIAANLFNNQDLYPRGGAEHAVVFLPCILVVIRRSESAVSQVCVSACACMHVFFNTSTLASIRFGGSSSNERLMYYKN